MSTLRETVTVCITMGRRPDLLTQTLQSLQPLLAEMRVLAINDFRDAPTNEAFHSVCPHGEIVEPGQHLGHHGAVDFIYAQVKTPYILHLEDDWTFDRLDFIEPAIALLEAEPKFSQVCLRKLSDFPFPPEEMAKAIHGQAAGVDYARLDPLHKQWYGWTFNPHIARVETWRQITPLTQYKKERHISRALRAKGWVTAFLTPGPCAHIGEDASVSTPKPGMFKRFKTWVRGR